MIKSVLIIHRHLIYGGAEKYTLNLANSLADRGVNVTLIAGNGPLASRVSPKVNLFLMPISRKPRIKRITELKILEIAKTLKPEIIHTHDRTSLVNSQLARKVLNIPLVTHEHHMYLPDDYEFIVNELIDSADKIITVGPYAAKALVKNGVDKKNITTILGGVDVKNILPISDYDRYMARKLLRIKYSDKIVICLSRIEPGKGIDKLALAFIKVAKEIPNAKLLIIGDDELRLVKPYVQKLIEENNIQGKILLFKGDYEIRKFHAAADIFCYPALSKGMSVMEAMAAGLPVVGKETKRKPLVVEDEISGLMTKKTRKYPINSSSIAEKLIYLLERPWLSKQMGKAGRLKIERDYNLKRVIDENLVAYEEIIADHKKSKSKIPPRIGEISKYLVSSA